MWRWATEEGHVRLGLGGIHTVTITHIHYTNRGVMLPVSTSFEAFAVSPSSENQSMLCSMSYYPRLLPTHLLIMDPYSPRIAHKIYKCDNKTNIEELFLPLQSEQTLRSQRNCIKSYKGRWKHRNISLKIVSLEFIHIIHANFSFRTLV